MEYADLVDIYAELEATSATLEKQRILAETFATVEPELLERIVTLIRGKVFPAWQSTELGVSSSLTQSAIATATGIAPDRIEDWWREEGDLGNAAAIAIQERTQQPLFVESLTVQEVHETLQELATYTGEGSQQRRIDTIAGLLSRASPSEAKYLVRTIVGAMRLGVGEGLIRDGLAAAFLDDTEDAVDAVRRAYEVTNDFTLVARRARTDGQAGLRDLSVEVFRPIKPMLAKKAESLSSALQDLSDDQGTVLLETKYDGIRAKLHREDDEIRVFTRRLEDVTTQFPDVKQAVADRIDGSSFIIEAEVVGYDPDTWTPVPFQELTQRIKRKYDIAELAEEIPVVVYCFDLLYLDGESYLDAPLRERLDTLNRVLSPEERRIERAQNATTTSQETAEQFHENALGNGHEGVMVKNLDAFYQPGDRVGYQRKVKPTMEPLDLVVTRAKWSEGRKSEFLGRPYLACRTEDGEFQEVGRLHTGFTDADLAEFTELLEPLIREIDGREATLRPEVILEVAYEEIQQSPKYESGYALRFPRFKQIRYDLDPTDIDTRSRIESLYADQE